MPTKAQLQEQLKREREFTADLQKRYDKLLVANAGYTANYKEYKSTERLVEELLEGNNNLKGQYEGLEHAFRIVIGKENNGE